MKALFIGFLLSAIASFTIVQSTCAQEEPQLPYERDRFSVTVKEIADGVHVMIREPSWRLPVQANTTLIVNESDAIIIDGGFGAHAENMVQEVRRITDNPVTVIINTHWHGDHNVGHYVFKREWPDAQIIAHEETRRLMAREGVMDYITNTVAMEEEEQLDPHRERLAALRSEGADPGLVAYTEDFIEGLPVVRDDYARWEIALADQTFAERLVLHRGERAVEILYFGIANTPGDAIIWLPGQRIVVTGDTVVRPTPYGFGSRPASWAGVLREINALGYGTLVPGHGDIQSNTDYVDLLIRTMDLVAAGACAAVADRGEEADADAARAAIDWAAVEPDFTGGDPLLTRLFEDWFKRPISNGAIAEIHGDEIDACG